MAICARCKIQETQLYESGVPLCLNCIALREAKSKKQHSVSVHDVLVRELADAKLRAEAASTEFNAITSDIPSFIPPPDGAQRIHNASHDLAAARDTMMKAHRRLNEFLERGVVPEDLKQSG